MPQETFPKPRKEINDPKEAELAALRERNEQLETEKAGMAELLGKVGEKADRTHIEGEKFKHEATHDKLTGLLRRSDDKELEKLLSETGLEKKDRREAHEIFTVVMLDIDHFKEINEYLRPQSRRPSP